ncbi:hypothetical protein [Mycolicibacterium llatzerense]|uniref:hypothetical protein n=1 Tax=Mycolicibacterium llatzerense TaxID=280871 RepID=UPI0031D86424
MFDRRQQSNDSLLPCDFKRIALMPWPPNRSGANSHCRVNGTKCSGHGVHEVLHRLNTGSPRDTVLFPPAVNTDLRPNSRRKDLVECHTGGEFITGPACADLAGVLEDNPVRALHMDTHGTTQECRLSRCVVGNELSKTRNDRIYRRGSRQYQITVDELPLARILIAEKDIALGFLFERVIDPTQPEQSTEKQDRKRDAGHFSAPGTAIGQIAPNYPATGDQTPAQLLDMVAVLADKFQSLAIVTVVDSIVRSLADSIGSQRQ